MVERREAIFGVILGTALGDALGLPYEGLGPRQVARRRGAGPLRHSLLFGRGLVSDDTEHTCMVAAALIESEAEPERFARALARRLRWWLVTLPPGIGWATLRGILKLWLGWSPGYSGVRSAGNGTAMRAALLGVIARDDEHLHALVRASTRLTHTDERAEQGAWLIARWARIAAAGGDPEQLATSLRGVANPDLRERVELAHHLALEGASPDTMATRLGCLDGVSGFVLHTVPAALFCWLRYRGDARAAIEAAIRLGGDTDTVAAIVGALVGARLGASELPTDWVAGLRDWPLTHAHMHELATTLHEGGTRAPRIRLVAGTVRNLALLAVVVLHVLGRVRWVVRT